MAKLTAMQVARIERDRVLIVKKLDAARKDRVNETVAKWADKKNVK